MIDIEHFHKKADGFKKTTEFKKVEVCKIVRDLNNPKSPFIVRELIKYMKTIINGNIFEACDITGEIRVNNLTLKDCTLLELWPTGIFRTDILIYDEIEKKIGFLSVENSFVKK